MLDTNNHTYFLSMKRTYVEETPDNESDVWFTLCEDKEKTKRKPECFKSLICCVCLIKD